VIRNPPFNSRIFLDALLRDFSAQLLVASNVLTILLAVAFQWDAVVLLIGYWLQSVIIGAFNFFRILTIGSFVHNPFDKSTNKRQRITLQWSGNQFQVQPIAPTPAQVNAPPRFNWIALPIAAFLAGFFAVHYGFFHIIYGFFLLSFMPNGQFSSADIEAVLFIGGIFLVTHAVSFFMNLRSEIKNANRNIGLIFFEPYLRIIPMHLTIIFGGILLWAGLGNSLVLLLFLVLKTGSDLAGHFMKHGLQHADQAIPDFTRPLQ